MPTLIKNGLVYDGTEAEPQKRDILIERKRIVFVGNAKKRKITGETIDASGAIVTPGFIDVQAHSDHNLSIFSDPAQEHFIEEGITTIIGGNCGKSTVPFNASSFATLADWENHETSFSANWTTAAEFFSALFKKGLGVNFGTLIGLGTIRNFVLNGTARDLTDSQFGMTKKLLSDSLSAGALGFSSGTEHADQKNIPNFEIAEYVKIAAEYGGVYAAHLRDTGKDVGRAAREAVKVSLETGARLEISHFNPPEAFEREYEDALYELEAVSAESDVHFDVSPMGWSAVSVRMFLPKFYKRSARNDVIEALKNKSAREHILAHLRKNHFDKVRVGRVSSPVEFLAGKKIADIAALFGTDQPEAFVRIMMMTGLSALCLVETENGKLLKKFIRSPRSIIASNTAGTGFNEYIHSSEKRQFSKILKETFHEEEFALEKMIAKMTSVPAKKYRIGKRGLIREGYYADIAILDNFAARDVFVNGARAMKNGEITRTRSGHILKRKNN